MQREAENGRLLRLLMKLCYICERPELGGDSQWAETGDRQAGRNKHPHTHTHCTHTAGCGVWCVCDLTISPQHTNTPCTAAATPPNLLAFLFSRQLQPHVSPTPGAPPPPPHPPQPRRYLLKLFRDFVFHQVDEEGAPLLDWGLAAEALNKVDAGVPEKVRRADPGKEGEV